MEISRVNFETAQLRLCNHCLGRLYGMLGHGLTNEERGKAIRIIYAMEKGENYEEMNGEECLICGGIFSRLDEYANYISSLLSEYEYGSFAVGSRFSEGVMEKERELVEKYSSEEFAEPINREFNRELGKRIMNITGKEARTQNSDITVIVDTEYDDVRLEIKPLYIYGRYRKLIRGIPQTKWPSGKYRESVEEIIAAEVMKETRGEGHALHGLGREDVDARMLGNGRPFVLEIKRPRKRSIDPREMERRINESASGKVEVTNLMLVDREWVKKVKSAIVKKRYRVGIRVDAPESDVEDALRSLVGKIRQRTPRRVSHRRADKVRVREVYEAKLVGKEGDTLIVEVLADSGTYIKELMHGDEGRTKPSLAERLGKSVEVAFLDVIEILDNFP